MPQDVVELSSLPSHGPELQQPGPVYRGSKLRHATYPPTDVELPVRPADGPLPAVHEREPAKQDRAWSVLIRPWTVVQWWTHYIDPLLVVQNELGQVVHDPRDFLALERTHLAYIRTSNVLALFGVTTAQLFVLNNADSVHGRWLAVAAYILAVLLALSSAVRTIWLQDKLVVHRTATTFWLYVLFGGLIVGLIITVLIFNVRT